MVLLTSKRVAGGAVAMWRLLGCYLLLHIVVYTHYTSLHMYMSECYTQYDVHVCSRKPQPARTKGIIGSNSFSRSSQRRGCRAPLLTSSAMDSGGWMTNDDGGRSVAGRKMGSSRGCVRLTLKSIELVDYAALGAAKGHTTHPTIKHRC